MLLNSIQNVFYQLKDIINQLSDEDYCQPNNELSNATIGEHIRHILEMFECLVNQYEDGIVNYDKRKRDIQIQTNKEFAKVIIENILQKIDKPNIELNLCQSINNKDFIIETNYFRELLYNLEHCIHHQALIKVALLKISSVNIDDCFGVAVSTLEYRKKCAQ